MCKKNFLLLYVFAIFSAGFCRSEKIKVSVNPSLPENVYFVHCALQDTTMYWSSTGGPKDLLSAGRFAFYSSEKENEYYIYNVDLSQFVSYDNSEIKNAVNFSTNVSEKEEANVWRFTYKEIGNSSYYEIQPICSDGTPAAFYVNWIGGSDVFSHSSLGLWKQSGDLDAGSTWAIEKINPDYIVFGNEYYVCLNNANTQDVYVKMNGDGYDVSDNNAYSTKFSLDYVGLQNIGSSYLKSYSIKDISCGCLLAYTQNVSEGAGVVVPLSSGDLSYSGNVKWTFRAESLLMENDIKRKGFAIMPGKSLTLNWGLFDRTLGFKEKTEVAVAEFVPANLEAMNNMLASVKSMDYVYEEEPLGGYYNRKASAFINQSEYSEYSFDVSKKLVEAYYSEPEYITKPIKYILTDGAGTKYRGTTQGVPYEFVEISGAGDVKLSNERWTTSSDGTYNYSADILFAFPVSSSRVKQYTYIGIGETEQSLLYVCNVSDGNSGTLHYVKLADDDIAKLTNETNENYEWAIIPSCVDGEFTFRFLNRRTNLFFNTQNGEGEKCALLSNGSYFSYASFSDNEKGFCLKGTDDFLVVSAFGSGDMYLTLKNKGDVIKQNGSFFFLTPIDFSSLMNELKDVYEQAQLYFDDFVIGDELGKYSQIDSFVATGDYKDYLETKEKVAQVLESSAFFNKYEFEEAISVLNNYDSFDLTDMGLELNMPIAGKFYRFYGYGNNLNESNIFYMASALTSGEKLQSLAEVGNNTIFYLTEDCCLLSYSNGYYYNGVVQAELGGNDRTVFKIDETPQNIIVDFKDNIKSAGTYRISYGDTPTYLIDWGGGNVSVTDNGEEDWIGWRIEEVTEIPVTVSSVTGGLATLYSPVALDIPENIYAYVATLSEDGKALYLKKIMGGVIPAGVGVLIRSTEELIKNKIYNFPITVNVAEHLTSELTGDIATSEMQQGVTYYSLQTKNGTNAGFYRKSSGNIVGFKSYLSSSVGSSPFVFSFADDDLTGVAEIPQNISSDNVYRDLLGRPVVSPIKGQLYIINGRQILY